MKQRRWRIPVNTGCASTVCCVQSVVQLGRRLGDRHREAGKENIGRQKKSSGCLDVTERRLAGCFENDWLGLMKLATATPDSAWDWDASHGMLF